MTVPDTYELTVAGPLGPVLSGVLPASRVETVETTVLRVDESAARSLVDVLAVLEAAGVQVQEVHRLRSSRSSDGPGSGSPVLDDARSLPRA